jgi:hypothetical protein
MDFLAIRAHLLWVPGQFGSSHGAPDLMDSVVGTKLPWPDHAGTVIASVCRALRSTLGDCFFVHAYCGHSLIPHLKMTGSLSATVGYTFPSINYAIGCTQANLTVEGSYLTEPICVFSDISGACVGVSCWPYGEQQWL